MIVRQIKIIIATERVQSVYFHLFSRRNPQAAGSLPWRFLWDHPQEADLHLHWAGAGTAHLGPAHNWHWRPKGQHWIPQIPVQLHPGKKMYTFIQISTHCCMCERTDVFGGDNSRPSFPCFLTSVMRVIKFYGNTCATQLLLLFTLDPVVLEGLAVLWSGRPGEVPTVCHWHIQGPPPGFCCSGGHERHPEVPDPPWWSLHWPPAICSYLVKT